MISFAYLAVLLAMTSSSVSAYPIADYSAGNWQFYYPWLNSELVQFCFFNKTEWTSQPESGNAKWCQVVTNPSQRDWILYPDELLRSINGLYKEHVSNEQHDQKKVLDCFVANRFTDKVANCDQITFDNQLGKTWALRQARVTSYLELLRNVSNQIDQCWAVLKSSDDAQFFKCGLLNELILVKHCSHYHTSKLMPTYEPCEQVIKPPSTPPTDTRSIARFIEWSNMTAKNDLEMRPFNDLPEKYQRYQMVLNNCYRTNDWLNNSTHWCQKIAKPVNGVKYGWLNLKLQKEWQRVTAKLIEEDNFYHQDQSMNKTNQ